MQRIYLIGYMGVGKTTLGKGLAIALNLGFVDMDLFIQNRYQKTVNQLFAEMGEEQFRIIENKILKEISDFEEVIISTGGGTPCFFDNMEYMNRMGTTIYLKSDPELLIQRLMQGRDKRPLLHNKTEEELRFFVRENLKLRDPIYSQAQFTFENGGLIRRDEIDDCISKMIHDLQLTHKKNNDHEKK